VRVAPRDPDIHPVRTRIFVGEPAGLETAIDFHHVVYLSGVPGTALVFPFRGTPWICVRKIGGLRLEALDTAPAGLAPTIRRAAVLAQISADVVSAHDLEAVELPTAVSIPEIPYRLNSFKRVSVDGDKFERGQVVEIVALNERDFVRVEVDFSD